MVNTVQRTKPNFCVFLTMNILNQLVVSKCDLGIPFYQLTGVA